MGLIGSRWPVVLGGLLLLGVALVIGCHRAGRGAGPAWEVSGSTDPVPRDTIPRSVPEGDISSSPGDGSGAGPGLAAQFETASVGLGLAAIADWSTEYPFLDLMKSARTWHDWAHKKPFNRVDANGWVEKIEAGETPAVVFLTVPEELPVPYPRLVVLWEGSGRLSYGWSARLISSDGANKRDLISVGHDSSLLQIEESDPKDPVRNIRIVPEQFEKQLLAGEIFNPQWLERVQGVRAVRFMDWMATNASTQRAWGERPLPQHRSWATPPQGETTQGVPVEIMVALANRLNADPWFNIPHDATDDYVKNFAALVRKDLAPHLVATVEYSNEVWNFSFVQSQYALKKAEKVFGQEGGAGWVQWGAMRAGQVCDIWKGKVFSDAKHRVHCTLGVHSGWEDLLGSTLDCPWAPPDHGKCFAHGFDSIAMTGYFSGCLETDDNVAAVRSWFTEPDGGVERAAEQLSDGRHFKCDATIAKVEARYRRFQTAAKARGLALVAYEGGQHVTANGHAMQDDQAFTDLFVRLNRSPQMGELYRKNFSAWRSAGGTLFMHFVDIAPSSKFGSWGALEHLGQGDSPKWHALRDFNAVPCWWDQCRRQLPN